MTSDILNSFYKMFSIFLRIVHQYFIMEKLIEEICIDKMLKAACSIFSCQRLGLTSLAYLWRRDQSELLKEMIDSGVSAILIKVASMGRH